MYSVFMKYSFHRCSVFWLLHLWYEARDLTVGLSMGTLSWTSGHQNTHRFHVYRIMDTLPPSVRTTQSHLPMLRNRLTVNRSARIKIISLSASRPASVSVSQRGRVSDERSMADVTFYSTRLKAHCSTRTRCFHVSGIFPTP